MSYDIQVDVRCGYMLLSSSTAVHGENHDSGLGIKRTSHYLHEILLLVRLVAVLVVRCGTGRTGLPSLTYDICQICVNMVNL